MTLFLASLRLWWDYNFNSSNIDKSFNNEITSTYLMNFSSESAAIVFVAGDRHFQNHRKIDLPDNTDRKIAAAAELSDGNYRRRGWNPSNGNSYRRRTRLKSELVLLALRSNRTERFSELEASSFVPFRLNSIACRSRTWLLVPANALLMPRSPMVNTAASQNKGASNLPGQVNAQTAVITTVKMSETFKIVGVIAVGNELRPKCQVRM